jgi:hypothetical protein
VKNLPTILCLLLLVLSCREPLSVERFIPAPGPYEFQVDMADTAASYDFSFYTRLDGRLSGLETTELPLSITWTSPSDTSYTEKVYMPLTGRATLFSRQVLQPYRADVRPWEAGQWSLQVVIGHTDAQEVMRGLGLVVKKNPDELGNN